MRFLEKQSVVGGSFLKYVEQYKEKNCDSKSPILSVSLEYQIMSVDKDVYSAILRNGSFSFANSTPPYCHSLKAFHIIVLPKFLRITLYLIILHDQLITTLSFFFMNSNIVPSIAFEINFFY